MANKPEKTVEELQAELEQQKAAFEAELEAQKAEKKKAEEAAKAAEAKLEAEKAQKTAKPSAEKKVKIKLYKDKNVKEDVQVFLNGRQFIIQRGVEVEVPAGVAEILANKERMLNAIDAYDAEHAK